VPILGPVERSPLKRYDASPAELQERLAAERSGSAFLVFRDAAGLQRLVPLDQEADAVTLGRGSACAIRITWDNEVSRVHAELARVGHEWTIADMGLSRNGTFVNGQHLGGKHLLADGDVIRIGRTLIGYRSTGSDDDATVTAGGSSSVPELSPAQRAVLVELCRPLLAEGGVTTAATNRQIADQLIVGLETVKTHMRALFDKFGIADLGQNQKRAALAEAALRTGAVSRRDVE